MSYPAPTRESLQGVSERPLPRIHLLSDLHLETGPYEVASGLEYDILVAAGDIGPVDVAVPWLAAQGKPVVYVLGNHERYGKDLLGTVTQAKRLAEGTSVHVLEREAVTLYGVRFLGATLWTDYCHEDYQYITAAWSHMRDFEYIAAGDWLAVEANRKAFEKLSARLVMPHTAKNEAGVPLAHPLMMLLEHRRTVSWLKRMLLKPFEGATVVVSHHAPSFESLRRNGIKEHELKARRFSMRDNTPARIAAYASRLIEDNLSESHRKAVTLWAHGHTHHGMDYVQDGVRVVCNPRGSHNKPLTAESAASYRLFGISFTEADVQRSQDEFARDPWRGTAPAFEQDLVLDMLHGRQRAVELAVSVAVQEMKELVSELEELLPHTGGNKSMADRCITECFRTRLEALNDCVDTVMDDGVTLLDAEAGTTVFARIEAPRKVYLWSSEFRDDKLDDMDFKRALDAAKDSLATALDLPLTLQRYITSWAEKAHTCLTALALEGISARVVALPAGAYADAQCVNLEFVLTPPGSSEDAAQSDSLHEQAEDILEKALNPKGPPRKWLTRVHLKDESAFRKLLTAEDVLPLALQHVSGTA